MVESTGQVRSILFVEPDRDLQELHKQTFIDQHTVFASSAFEAVREFNHRAFSAYVLEYWLPDWSGTALCREIRRVDPHAPVVFCSAAADQRRKERAFRAGASAYFVKPVEARLLRYRMDALSQAADRAGALAVAAEQQAIQAELERRAAWAREKANAARELSQDSLARTARARALKAFVASCGTRAQFEAWWPQVYVRSRGD